MKKIFKEMPKITKCLKLRYFVDFIEFVRNKPPGIKKSISPVRSHLAEGK